MRLILVRHGNTFEAGQTAVWLGAKDDLPLTSKGCAQAKDLGRALNSQLLTAIYSGPLRRTKETAEIIAEQLGYQEPIIIDERLIEIDYGLWSGLSDAQVEAKFGATELKAWTAKGAWPKQPGFRPEEAEIVKSVKEFTAELKQSHKADDQILVVSSNGILRYFLTLIAGELEQRLSAGQFKLGTGKAGIIDLVGASAKLIGWNLGPDELVLKVRKGNEI